MLKVIELFAGVGGFRLGLEATKGFEVVWGNQWEPSKKSQHGFDCYARNFEGKGIHSNEDIAQVNVSDLVKLNPEIIVGGFPCQDYSVARSLSGEQGIQGKKGVLFWEIMRLTREIRPKYLLLENVDRLLKSPSKQRGRDFSIMLASFHEIGYSVEWRVINAAQYGFAQRRRRVFIFAIRNDTPYIEAHKKTKDSKMIEQEGFFAGAFPVKGGYKTKFKPKEFEFPTDLVYVSDHFSAHYYNAGIMRNGRVYTEELIPLEEAPITLGDIVESNVDEKYYLSENTIEKFRYLKGPKKIERTAASGHKYIFSEGGMAFPDPLGRPGRTMLTSEGTTNRSTHVVEDLETNQLRILTPVECERLNGFPDDWTQGMSERMRYFCMGNALVVGLIERLGKRILEIEEQDKIAIRNHPQQLSLF